MKAIVSTPIGLVIPFLRRSEGIGITHNYTIFRRVDALRVLEQRDEFESPALKASLLEGVRSPHRPYGKTTLERVRQAARSAK